MDFTKDMLYKAKAVAERHVCDRCLGRQFAKVGTGMTNDVRGALIREELKKKGIESQPEEPCPLCEDIFDMLDRYAEAVAEAVNSVESKNFLVGSRVEPEIAKRRRICSRNSNSRNARASRPNSTAKSVSWHFR